MTTARDNAATSTAPHIRKHIHNILTETVRQWDCSRNNDYLFGTSIKGKGVSERWGKTLEDRGYARHKPYQTICAKDAPNLRAPHKRTKRAKGRTGFAIQDMNKVYVTARAEISTHVKWPYTLHSTSNIGISLTRICCTRSKNPNNTLNYLREISFWAILAIRLLFTIVIICAFLYYISVFVYGGYYIASTRGAENIYVGI